MPVSVGFRVFNRINRATSELVELFEGLSVSNIADTMNRILAANSRIKPINNAPLLGTAVTVKAPIGDNLMFHHSISMAQAGDVIIVDGGGCTERAICGENMMQIARHKGVRGFVIDGAIRDADAAINLHDFAVFASSIVPNASYKGLGPGEINIPVCVGGMVVFPGDIIVGDKDGVIAIRPSDAMEVAKKARDLKEKEEANLQLIKEGLSDRSWVIKALIEKGCAFFESTWDEVQ